MRAGVSFLLSGDPVPDTANESARAGRFTLPCYILVASKDEMLLRMKTCTDSVKRLVTLSNTELELHVREPRIAADVSFVGRKVGWKPELRVLG